MRRALCTALLLLAVSAPAAAQSSGRGDPYGQLYLSAIPDGRVPQLRVEPMEAFHVYLVTEIDFSDGGHPEWNDTNGLTAWEAAVYFPPQLMVTGSVSNPRNAVNLASGANWLIGLGEAFLARDSPHRLVTFTCVLVQEGEDLLVRVGPAQPSTFGTGPGYVEALVTGECQLPVGVPVRCQRPFAAWYSLVVNCRDECPVVGVENPSWSRTKARFTP